MVRLLALLLGLATWEWFLVPFPPPLPAYAPRPRAGPEGITPAPMKRARKRHRSPQADGACGVSPTANSGASALCGPMLIPPRRSRRRTRERRGAVFLREPCNG